MPPSTEDKDSEKKRHNKRGGRGQQNKDNAGGDEGNNNTNPEISVLDFIKEHGYLFDMTAAYHGSSSSTTSQGSRPSVSGDKKRPADDDDARKNNTKRRKNQTSANRSSDDAADGQNNAATFEITEWNPTNFFGFLKSAENDMESLMIPKDHTSCNDFDDWMKSSLELAFISTEPSLDDYLQSRFVKLTDVLSLAFGEKNVYFGKKSNIYSSNVELPPNIGTDNQVDLLFLLKKENFERQSLIPWENKVSWNFPGGKVTSEDEDFARLGRDVKLDELVRCDEVQSLADTKHVKKGEKNPTARRTIANSAEGEDENEVRASPALKSNRRKPAAKVAPNPAKSKRDQQIEMGTYKMKEDVFPVRQLVAYMISLNSKYGILSTGYRLDFVKLEVVDPGRDNERLVAHIAGPLWSVGELNTRIMRGKNLRGDHYYNNIHTYGYNGLRSILGNNTWTTNIGPYFFMEGLLRFLFAASSLDQQKSDDPGHDNDESTAAVPVGGGHVNATGQATTGKGLPRSYMSDEEMPGWVGEYKQNGRNRQSENNHAYVELCKADGGQFGFEDDDDKKKYIMDMREQFGLDWSGEEEFSTGGLTKFGPLTLSELKSGQNTESIGCGRIGQALATTLDTGNIRIAYKLLRQSEWKTKEFDQRERELQDEMEIYKKLQSLQGVCIPRFLYAGSVVDASKWLIPDKGEMIVFATTYEGRSLSWYDEDPSRVPESLSQQKFDALVENAVQSLQKVHGIGVLHRDLELRNIVYEEGTNNVNQIKFVDFGNSEYFSPEETQKEQFALECDEEIKTLKALLHVFQPQPDESDIDSSETAVNAESETDAAAEHVESRTTEPLVDRPESAPPRS